MNESSEQKKLLDSIDEGEDNSGNVDVTSICNQICDSLRNKSNPSIESADTEGIIERNSEILSKEALMQLLEQVSRTLSLETNPKNQGRLCIGMAGYPNVGKSSVINTFLNASKSTHGNLLFLVLRTCPS